ncbi:MAG: alginate lyase family protein [Myxococcota bacterium]
MSASRLYHTIRFLRLRQIVGQIRVRWRGLVENPARFARRSVPPYPGCRWNPNTEFLPPGPQAERAETLLRGEFRFIGDVRQLGWPPPWDAGPSRLWRYNLHYFEFLWALGYADARTVVLDWIQNHTLARGRVGWEPYPTSLRLLNWCGYFFGRHRDATEADPEFLGELWGSIHHQAEWLEAHLETHLLGNHLLENAAALAMCGSCFDGVGAAGWLRRGRQLLVEQLPEQILGDGGHFEHSPMYQLRVAYVLTTLLNVDRPELTALIEEPLERVMHAMGHLSHPDRDIALFNDSALNVYNDPEALGSWWRAVRGGPGRSEAPVSGCFSLPALGYYGARGENGHYVICDAGALGPDYLLGHAHGGIFSFELSLYGRRVIVDSGVYGYETDEMRRYCRSTRAHNTVEIDGQSQCEFWAAFRVGRRGRPRDVEVETRTDGFRIHGWHDGYERLGGGTKHRREFAWHDRGVLMVRDTITSSRRVSGVSRLHLHPDCRIASLEGREAVVEYPGGSFRVGFAGPGELEVEDSYYCPEFGVRIGNRALAFTALAVPASSGSCVAETGFCIASEAEEFEYDLASGARVDSRSFGW